MRPRCCRPTPRRSFLASWAALALAAAAAGGCATISPQEEAALGAQMHYQIEHEAVLLRDPVVNRYVSGLGRKLAAAAGGGGESYRFFVIVDDEINAFAAPGGYIYVNTGTILRARNVSELAGVLAHEVGHVARRHVAQNVGRRRTANTARRIGVVAAAVAAGPAAAGAANLLGGLASVAALNSFDRDAEHEADAFAVEVLPRAGYDPEGLPSFFHTLMRQTSDLPSSSGSFLSDHPATEERIEATRRAIGTADLPPNLRSEDGGRLEIIQRRIQLLTGAADPEVPR
jgi:predicted Zn-dependent protease